MKMQGNCNMNHIAADRQSRGLVVLSAFAAVRYFAYCVFYYSYYGIRQYVFIGSQQTA